MNSRSLAMLVIRTTTYALAITGCAHEPAPMDARVAVVVSPTSSAPAASEPPAEVPTHGAVDDTTADVDGDCSRAPALRCDATRALRPLACDPEVVRTATTASESMTACRAVRDRSIPVGFTMIVCEGSEDAHGATARFFDDTAPYLPLAEWNGPPHASERDPRVEVHTVEGTDVVVIDSESFDDVVDDDDEEGEVPSIAYQRTLTVCVRDPVARCPLVGVPIAYGFARSGTPRATLRRRARRIGALAIDGARVAVVQRDAPEDFTAETTHFTLPERARRPELDATSLRATLGAHAGEGALDWQRSCARGVPSYAVARLAGVDVTLARSANADMLYVRPMSSSATALRTFDGAMTRLLTTDALAASEPTASGIRTHPGGVRSLVERGGFWLFAEAPTPEVSWCVTATRERTGLCDPVTDSRTRDAETALLGAADDQARQRAAETLESACERGDVHACTLVALRTITHDSRTRTFDMFEATLTSCELGDGYGCAIAGHLAVRVVGSGQGGPLAQRAYRRACALRNLSGCRAGAELEISGAAGTSMEEALSYYEQGCELGDEASCERRAVAALTGSLGTARSDEDAAAFFEQACAHGGRTGCIVSALLSPGGDTLAQRFAFDVRIGRSSHPRIPAGTTCTLRAGVIDTWMSFVARCGDTLLLSPTSYFLFTRDAGGAATGVSDPVTSEGDGDVALTLDFSARTIRISDSAAGRDGAFVLEGRLEPVPSP